MFATGEDRGDAYFLIGDVFHPYGGLGRCQALWKSLRDEFLAEWIDEHPGTRPWIWWNLDAPQGLKTRQPPAPSTQTDLLRLHGLLTKDEQIDLRPRSRGRDKSMPRKLRHPKARRDTVQVSRALFHLLLWGDWQGARRLQKEDGTNPWELFGWMHKQGAWLAIATDAVMAWVEVHPGSRPPAWWEWSAPELRALVGGSYTAIVGAGRCHPNGIPYIANWEYDEPRVESEPAFLDRFDLWVPGERRRVAPEAFALRPFSYAPMGRPTFDDDTEVA